MFCLPGVLCFWSIEVFLQEVVETVFYRLPFLVQEILKLALVRDPLGIEELLEIGTHFAGCCNLWLCFLLERHEFVHFGV